MKAFIVGKHDINDYRYAHLKRDGFFVNVCKTEAGLVRYTSSNGNNFSLDFLEIHKDLVLRLPREALLCCELWKPYHPASYISSGIAHKDREMVLECHGVAAGLSHKVSVCAANVYCRKIGIPFVPYFDRQKSPMSMGDWPDAFNLATLKAEGIVFKNVQYGDELKWKPKFTADLRISDAEPGKGKFEGLIGALVVTTRDGTVVANVSGMTDAERQALTIAHNNNALVGRIVEVEYQYVGSQGKLRHPVFVRLREDKDVADQELL